MNPKEHCDWETLLSINQAIFGLNEENYSRSLGLIINKFDKIHPLSYDLMIIQMIYYSFVIKNNNVDLFLNIIKEIRTFEESNKIKSNIFDIFGQFLNNKHTHESYYLLEAMIERDFLEPNIVENNNFIYFANYMSKDKLAKYLRKYGFINYEGLSNEIESHKKLIREGHNPNEIAKIIRNDEIEKLQEISSQTNFDFDQTIKPSLYERCSFINQRNVSLIDYAAFFSAVKCFKYLLMNGAKVENTGKLAVAGGNEEIIHLCEQNHSSFKGAYEAAIKFHRNDIFHYLYENKLEEINNLEELGNLCILDYNYEIFSFLLKEGMKIIDNIINETAIVGNIFLVEYFLKDHSIPHNILMFSAGSGNIELVEYVLNQKGIDINAKDEETALIFSSQNGHTEIVKLLLEHEGIDINAKDEWGKTALIWTSENGHTKIVKLLVEQEGIDINAKEKKGKTALMIASLNGYTKIVKLLLEQEGIDINAKEKYGKTALILASENGHTEIVKLLLEHEGIDINAKDEYQPNTFMD